MIYVKERILQKAEELFRRHGIRSITMDEIANQLGISKKTIYIYFEDKDQIVDGVISSIIAVNQQSCNQDRSIALNAIHEVFLAMEMMKEMFQNLNPIILYDLERNHPEAFKKFLQHKYKYLYHIMKENIERGIDEDLYRPELDADVVAKVRLETMMLSFDQQIFPKTKYNLYEVEEQLIELYLYGMASLKGRKMIVKYKQDRKKS